MSDSEIQPSSRVKLLLRGVKILLAAVVLMIAVVSISLFSLVTTEAGAKLLGSLLMRTTTLQLLGVSGSLSRHLAIQHVEFHSHSLDVVLDDLEIDWQPAALWHSQLQLDKVSINSLQLAMLPGDDKPLALPASLQLPGIINVIKADQLVIHSAKYTALNLRREATQSVQFSELKSQLLIDAANYQLQLSGTTPWGSANLTAGLASKRPFNLNAQLDWQGLALSEHGSTLPATHVHAKATGQLERIVIQAQLAMADNPALMAKGSVNQMSRQAAASGQVQAIVTPFAQLPIESLQFDVQQIAPAVFYADAPAALLRLKGNLNVTGNTHAPQLQGHVDIDNRMPIAWNLGGIPVVGVHAVLTLTEHAVHWDAAQIKLESGGSLSGSGQINFDAHQPPHWPDLSSTWMLDKVDLLSIDSRLKKTRLNGKIQANTTGAGLQLNASLQEQQTQLTAGLNASVLLTNAQVIELQKIELLAKDARLSLQGRFALDGKQQFTLQGDAHNFNPARWIDVPQGNLATHFNVTGQLQQGWRVDAHVSQLSGQFAGQDVHGVANFSAQQNHLLAIQTMVLDWGKSHFMASGNWHLGDAIKSTQTQPQPQTSPLQLSIAIPDLAALSHPFEKIMPFALTGTIYVDGSLSGNLAQPVGQLNINATQVSIPNRIALQELHAKLVLASGVQGKFEGDFSLTGLDLGSQLPASAGDSSHVVTINKIVANLSGTRHAHQLHLMIDLPQQHQLTLLAQGDLTTRQQSSLEWQAQIQELNLSGAIDLKLNHPFAVQLAADAAQIGAASWQGQLGQVQIQQLSWSHGQVNSTGQVQGFHVIDALKIWRPDLPVSGSLQLDAAWQLAVGSQLAGQIEINRRSGDVSVLDVSHGHTQIMPLGLQKLIIKGSVAAAAEVRHTTEPSSQQLMLQLQAQGDHLGVINADMHSALTNGAAGWQLATTAPIAGSAQVQIPDIQFLSHLLGSGVALRGQLSAQATFAGSVQKPDVQAQIHGAQLQVALTELGVLLPNGVLEANLTGEQFTLTSLKFSQTIKAPPRHEKLADLNWLNETGFVESSGSIDFTNGHGAINTHWQRFPFLQNPVSWMVASGDAQLIETDKSWNLTGQLQADAAYFSVPKQASPKLSSDVVVLEKNAQQSRDKSTAIQTSLDFLIKTGDNFIFVGRGLDTSLQGDIRIRSKNNGTLQANGSIQMVGGNYEGYGQQLAIERGIINFQGTPDNPGLNVRAMRRGLAVEAGVEVIGTVDKPEVHLISEPNVPDPDKLSWMVLGRASDQMAGSESALLMSAAGAIFGGDDGSNMPRDIAHSLGLDGISVGTSSNAPGTQLPTQTVAGTIASTVPGDQVFSVGKHITPNLIFSIERSLTDATNGIKLTWQITRRFSLIGRAGSDTAIDGQYTFSFDSKRTEAVKTHDK